MFDWDEDNLRHVAEHGVEPEEAEQVLDNDPVDGGYQQHTTEERYINIGVTDAQRVLVVITTWRGDLLRVVTAYPASQSVREFYASERRGNA